MSASLLPVNLVSLLHNELEGIEEPHETRLRVSTDLLGSLRHAQLRIAGAPQKPLSTVDLIRLETGNMWHRRANEMILSKGYPFMQEVRLTNYLPEGWGGRADWLFFHPELRAWVLGDLKTARGESFSYLSRDGAKSEHIWQLSAYFYALLDMGLDMVNGFFVLYWPMNAVVRQEVEPRIEECEPLSREEVYGLMQSKYEAVTEYLDSLTFEDGEYVNFVENTAISPEMERVPKLIWNKQRDCFDVKLVPHWSTAYCPFEDDLCACNRQGVTKIGEWRRDTPYEFNITNESVYIPLDIPQPSVYDWRRHESRSSG